MIDLVEEAPALQQLLSPPSPAGGSKSARPQAPRGPLHAGACLGGPIAPGAGARLGGTHDLLYAILAADIGLRNPLPPQLVQQALRAAHPLLRKLSPTQLSSEASVNLEAGCAVAVDGVQDALAFVELYRGMDRRLGVCGLVNAVDMEDFMRDWLRPFIGLKLERAPKVAHALRGQLWERIAQANDPREMWGQCQAHLSHRFGMAQSFLHGRTF